MCGLTGIFEYGLGRGSVDRETLVAMRDTMVHRGPDGAGAYVSDDRRIGLGHRRLAIVDPEHGQQPMRGPDDVCVVFNGEIYNYPALRTELERDGVRFETNCDTEVLLHLYRRDGEGMLDHLVGMFAFALWDGVAERLLLARDPAGEKPLYWADRGGRLVFGSEIKSLLAHPQIDAAVNRASLGSYLANLVVPAPETMFDGIFKLPPGTALSCDRNGPAVRRYRQLAGSREWTPRPPGEAAARVRELLEESIDARLMADVPVGVLLSGGLDSTTLVGALHARGRSLPTFSVGFAEPDLDERHHARRVAEHYGTDHYEIELSERMALDFLPTLIHHQDEPLGDPVCMPVHFVSGLARENGVKVVLAGEGADELFWGYPRYMKTMAAWKYISAALRMPRAVRAMMPRAARLARNGYVAEALEGVAAGRLLPMHSPLGLSATQRRLVLGADAPNPWKPSAPGAGESALDTLAFDSQEYEFELRLPELLLMRIDRFSMSNSVEARVPFLDPALIDYVYSLPVDAKLADGVTKLVMRRAINDIVPDWVLARPKQGFGAPVVSWLQLKFGELLRELLRSGELAEMIDPVATEKMIRRRELGAWPVLNFALWHHYWVAGEPLDELIASVAGPPGGRG